MRNLILTMALAACTFISSESEAQEIIPRALYNPATGDVYFDNLDPILEFGRGRLLFSSSARNIKILDIFERRAGGLSLHAQATTFPSGVSEGTVLWQLVGPFDDAFEQPVYAGSIVEPGTDINDLVIQSFWFNKEPRGEVVLIPEPDTVFLMIFSGIVLLPVRRRR